MRTLMLFALLAASAWAQLVTVSGSVVDPTGTSVVGVVNVAWPTFMYSGIPVTAGSKDFRPVSGTLTVIVYPGNYTVTYRMQNGQTVTMYWHVPNDGVTTRTIAQVQTTFPNPPTNYPLPVGLGGSGNASLTPGRCIGLNSSGTAFESAAGACGTGGSGLTSVGLILPSIFGVTGSPLTSNGNITATLTTQSPNTVFRGPSFGAAATPSFGPLVAADMPVGGFALAPQTYTVSGLPASPATGTVVVVTDASAVGNCVSGGGSARALCRYNGSSWESVGDGVPAHAASHQNGGSDEVATATPGANAIPKSGAGGKLASGWLPDPAVGSKGGVEAKACSGTDKVSAIGTDGIPVCSADQNSGGGGGGSPNTSFSFTSATTATLLGSSHGYGTANLLVQCFTNATPRAEIGYNTLTIHPSTYDVTVTFATAQTGVCHVNGSGGGGGSANCACSASGGTLSIGQCNFTSGEKPVSIASASLALSGTLGTSTAYVYASAGTLWAGSSPGAETRTCTNCSLASGAITGFPADSWPVCSVPYTNNVFGTVSQKAYPAFQGIEAGTSGNIVLTSKPNGSKEIELGTTFDVANRPSRPFQSGLDASKPTSGCFPGMMYFATDTGSTYKNTATGTCSWSSLAAAGGGSTILRMSLGGVGTGGTPQPTWSAAGSTGLSYPFSDGQAFPTGAQFADPTGGSDSSEVATWFDLPPTYTGGAITINAWGYPGGTGSNGQVAKLEFRAACITSGTTDAGTTTYSGTVTMDMTVSNATAGISHRGTATLSHGGCTADKQIKMAVRRLLSGNTLTARFVLTNVTAVIP